MSQDPRDRLAVSVRDRLLNLARAQGQPFDLILIRYATERLLYRLSLSAWRDQFIVKGATLFALWTNAPYRPTRDLDLLGPPLSARALEGIFKTLCAMNVPDDGLILLGSSLQVEPIRGPDAAGGVRIKLNGDLAGARIPMQIDIGLGDVVVPSPEAVTFPTLLAMPPATVLACTRYTTVAEKLHAMATLGIANSRMKDYHDLWVLSRRFSFDGETLRAAIRATFTVRQSAIPPEAPIALSGVFATDAAKQTQWRAYSRKARLGDSCTLAEVVATIGPFLVSPLIAARSGEPFPYVWAPGGPWVPQ